MFSPERCQHEGMDVLSVTVSEHTWETLQSVTIINEIKSFPGLGGGSHLGWGCGRELLTRALLQGCVFIAPGLPVTVSIVVSLLPRLSCPVSQVPTPAALLWPHTI